MKGFESPIDEAEESSDSNETLDDPSTNRKTASGLDRRLATIADYRVSTPNAPEPGTRCLKKHDR